LKWFELLPGMIQIHKQACITPNLFNVDLKSALSMCGFEIGFMLGSLWG